MVALVGKHGTGFDAFDKFMNKGDVCIVLSWRSSGWELFEVDFAGQNRLVEPFRSSGKAPHFWSIGTAKVSKFAHLPQRKVIIDLTKVEDRAAIRCELAVYQ
ncbi:hypothetical protein SAMN05216228_107312 [Rhizobium tibeticum]|uniref:Uncharacterized protein n=1 Tax=Rhizobium tibeticum TaxID=501024 RepID=A0ABY1AY15_9HYPH|nr:hypothetical protein [Rhizobium tibeticum]SEP29704.1 hypothetical protein SAMN05216228_107312 [Rhizobium tibeticum]